MDPSKINNIYNYISILYNIFNIHKLTIDKNKHVSSLILLCLVVCFIIVLKFEDTHTLTHLM